MHAVAIGYYAIRGLFKQREVRHVRETVGAVWPFDPAYAAMDAGLDEEFKRIVAEMKPHAKKLPQKSSEER